MDRESLLRHRQITEQHITAARENIASVERRIIDLGRDGHDTSSSEELLATLSESLGLHESDLALVQKQIEDLDCWPED